VDTKRIEEEQNKWKDGPLKEWLGRYKESKEQFSACEGQLTVNRLYTPVDLDKRGIDYVKDIGFPGMFPYTRGIEPTMHRAGLWDTSNYIGLGTPAETNERLKYLMSEGMAGVFIALDLPTQFGFDSDSPMARKEVGRVGVAIDSLEDMEELFAGVPLDTLASVRTTANAIGPIWLALMYALSEKQGVDPNDIHFVMQNDGIREIMARGTQIFPIKPSLKFSVDAVEYCAKNLPNWFPLQIADYHYKQKGAPPIPALAFAFCTVIAYIESAMARGIDIDKIAPSIEWTMAIDQEFLEGIARFRAARRLWARIIKERYEAKNPESLKMKIDAFGYGFPLTAQEPLNNIIRITIECLALALSSPQAMHLPSYDEARNIPGAEPAKIALRTQQIVGYETGITNTVDPLGGSYYIEYVTDEIEKQVLDVIREVDEMGGAVAAMEGGFYNKVMARGAYEYQKAIERGERVVVSVNKFQSQETVPIKAFKVDPEGEAKQIAKLKELKKRRDNRAVQESLKELQNVASKDENTVPAIINAVKNYATVGEICDTLRQVWGEWQATSIFLDHVY